MAALRIEGIAPSKQLYLVRREDTAMNGLVSRFIEFIMKQNGVQEREERQTDLLEHETR